MPDQTMTAVVEFQIRPENASMPEWLEVWDLRGEDARAAEPETIAYGTAVNLEDSNSVLVFERYRNGRQSLDQHIARPSHAALTQTMGDRKMTRRRVMSMLFDDVPGFGWWRRDEALDQEGVVLYLVGMRFRTPAVRDQFIEFTAGHAEYCWREEPETLIYSAGVASRDADREVDLKRGDLVFVMACTDMAAVQKHSEDPNHLALGPKRAELGIERTSTFTRGYRSTGNGFLWR